MEANVPVGYARIAITAALEKSVREPVQ